jgi:thiamine biosynthesis lipoprotein
MSTWRDDSELSRIRASDGPVEVSEDTALVVREALEIAAATGGAFDPTVQPLVEVWGLHGAKRTSVPSDEELAAAMAHVGWRRVTLARTEALVPTVDSGGTALDLSAIAKGHAVDRVSSALSALGIPSHMVEIGGEVRVAGPSPSGGPWRVGVDVPREDSVPGRALADVLEISNAAIATSGNYRNVYAIGDLRVVHTLDPRRGRPVESGVASATVVASDCRTADGWATALMVMGEAGLPLIEARRDIEALLLVVDGDGFAPRQTSGMERFVAELDPASSPTGAEGGG